MFQQIKEMSPSVLAVEASGQVSHEDYRDSPIPKAKAMMGQGPAGMLYVIGPDFSGFDVQALADDAGAGLTHLYDFSQIAVVSDHLGLNALIARVKPFFHGEVRVFRPSRLDQARDWVKGGPHHG